MTRTDPTRVLAPAKVNLSLHVTGRRADGYHLLDSLVMFAGAEAADWISVAPGDLSLDVVGPMAAGVPVGPENLVLRAARLAGMREGRITLDKHLPHAAGIGGGTADGAAVIRASGADGLDLLSLGADMPVCVLGRAARMRGVGEDVSAVEGWPGLPSVLVNPGVAVSTPDVFRRLVERENAPMPEKLPGPGSVAEAMAWLGTCRNDLERPACTVAPGIGAVLEAIGGLRGCGLARMSGSGATCFGLFETIQEARRAAEDLSGRGWWVRSTVLS